MVQKGAAFALANPELDASPGKRFASCPPAVFVIIENARKRGRKALYTPMICLFMFQEDFLFLIFL
jgi:hypothetical protein